MSISNEFNDLIEKRKTITDDVDYDNNPVIKSMVSLLAQDVPQTVAFIMDNCSKEQFVWMSEILDELIMQTKSTEIINALRLTAQKYPDAAMEYNISYFIDSAAEYLS